MILHKKRFITRLAFSGEVRYSHYFIKSTTTRMSFMNMLTSNLEEINEEKRLKLLKESTVENSHVV